MRSHVARWKDGRHFQQATRVSIFVSAGQAAADANFLEDAADDESVKSAGEHRSSVDRFQGEDRQQPGTQLPLLPMCTAVDVNSCENETRN